MRKHIICQSIVIAILTLILPANVLAENNTNLLTTFERTILDGVESVVILNQPNPIEAEVGETVSFTVEASGVSGYQWYL